MKINKFTSTCMIGLLATALASCSDTSDIIDSLVFDRNFAPLEMEASGVKETSAIIKWKVSTGATNYTLEVYADDSLTFQGSPVKVIENLTADDIPYTVNGLLFDTKYSARVQAITDGNGSRTSKWNNGVFFRTNTKQFLKNPKPADISDRSVTLTWEVEEGFDVTTIVVGDITHEITAEEKVEGKATISGLTPETAYTAYLYYNGKQCGNRPFTTIADLEGAIILHDTDDLKKAIESEGVTDGTVFALYGGKYYLNATYDEGTGELISTGAAKVTKSISIKGIYPTDRPVIKGRFEIYDGAGLTLSQVVLDGKDNGTADQLFNYKLDAASPGVEFGPLDVQSCDIYGKTDAKGLLYLNVQAIVTSITFNKCIISGIQCAGGDFIDSRAGLPRVLNITNTTFYDVAGERDFIRIDDASGKFEGENGPLVTVDRCTFSNVGGANKNYRLLYVRFLGNKLTFTNNVVVGTTYKRGFTDQSKSDADPTLNNNFYFDCENLTSPGLGASDAILWFDTDSGAYDKQTDAGTVARGKGNGTVLSASPFSKTAPDFTLNPDSPAAKAGAGDPRWLGK